MHRTLILVLVAAGLLCGCRNTYPRVKLDKSVVELREPRFDVPEELLFDVRIAVFEPGEIPTSADAARGLSQTIRDCEASYVAIELKRALQRAGQWGQVRVVPTAQPGDEVTVEGRILRSNGEQLMLQVTAHDASGRRWFDKSFRCAVSEEHANQAADDEFEQFASIYHQIANELGAHRNRITVDDTLEIRQIAEMRFASQLLPDVFAEYVREDQQRYALDRLPAAEDEPMQRVRRVRASDHMLVETFDQHYASLHREMKPQYSDWRRLRIREMGLIRKTDDLANKQTMKAVGMVVVGVVGAAAGAAASANSNNRATAFSAANAGGQAAATAIALATRFAAQAQETAREAELSKDALEELGSGLTAEMRPISSKVEGRVVQLSGSAKEQYTHWRHVLTQLYKAENEVLPEPNQ